MDKIKPIVPMDLLDGDSSELEFDLVDFDNIDTVDKSNEHTKPKVFIAYSPVKYENAQELAKNITIKENEYQRCLVSGNFVFGDFLEAYVFDRKEGINNLLISTLTMSEHNVWNLKNIIDAGAVKHIDLILSSYFYSHEKHRIMRVLLEEIKSTDFFTFRIGIARSHVKLTMFDFRKGDKVVMSGSANLRSSNCIEEFVIQENKTDYDFYKKEYFDIVLKDAEFTEEMKMNLLTKKVFNKD